MLASDTIAALATPPGEGGIGIVRMSGPRALDIAYSIFRSPRNRKPAPWRVIHGFVMDPLMGHTVDEVLVTYMKAPHSYTCEDVIEIGCHGGAGPVREVLGLCLANGARAAGPGEFTRRAFLNGRIDLSQAEAVLDLIRARTGEAERLAMAQLGGGLGGRITVLRDIVAGALAHLEAHMDFPEEEIEPRAMAEITRSIQEALQGVQALSASYDTGRMYREGVRVAIVGRPNVGKSSLLNALLMRDRAIVTDLPGTTRDVIEEGMNVRGLPVVVMDTAGIREAHDMAEREGVRRSLDALQGADLALVVLDASEPLHPGDTEIMERVRGRRAIAVVNKCDLGGMSMAAVDLPMAVGVSALLGEGMDALRDAIYAACVGTDGAMAGVEGVMVTSARHRGLLDASGRGLEGALSGLAGGAPIEIAALELRESLDRLGEIVGAVTTDAILERIFDEFCIGK